MKGGTCFIDPCIGYLHGIRYGRKSLALDVVEPFRQPVIDRLTIRLLNRGDEITEESFEGGEKGLRLDGDTFKRYLGQYEEQLRSESGGDGSPSWRVVIRQQVSELKEMVMSNKAGPLYTWSEKIIPAKNAE